MRVCTYCYCTFLCHVGYIFLEGLHFSEGKWKSGSGGEGSGMRGIKGMKGTYNWDVLKTKHTQKYISCNDTKFQENCLQTLHIYFILPLELANTIKLKM